MAATFIITDLGQIELAANGSDKMTGFKLADVPVGAGTTEDPIQTPSKAMTTATGVVYPATGVAGFEAVSFDPLDLSKIVYRILLDEEVGDFKFTQILIYNAGGDLCAVANSVPIQKNKTDANKQGDHREILLPIPVENSVETGPVVISDDARNLPFFHMLNPIRQNIRIGSVGEAASGIATHHKDNYIHADNDKVIFLPGTHIGFDWSSASGMEIECQSGEVSFDLSSTSIKLGSNTTARFLNVNFQQNVTLADKISHVTVNNQVISGRFLDAIFSGKTGYGTSDPITLQELQSSESNGAVATYSRYTSSKLPTGDILGAVRFRQLWSSGMYTAVKAGIQARVVSGSAWNPQVGLDFLIGPASSPVEQVGATLAETGFELKLGAYIFPDLTTQSSAGYTKSETNQSINTTLSAANAYTDEYFSSGTWTPVFASASGSFTCINQSGTWEKIGNTIIAHGTVEISADNAGSAAIWLEGLPYFAIGNGGAIVNKDAYFSYGGGRTTVKAEVVLSTKRINLWQCGDSQPETLITALHVSAGTSISVTAIYSIA